LRQSLINSINDDDQIKHINLDKLQENTETPSDIAQQVVQKPWGYEYLLYQDKDLAIWLLKLNSDKSTSLHCHLLKKTVMLVLSGNVVVSGLNESFNLKARDYLEIDKKTFHKTYAENEAFLIEIELPNQKLDLLRLSDDNGRINSTYEGAEYYSKIRKNYNYVDSKKFKTTSIHLKKYVNESEIFIGRLGNLLKGNFVDIEKKEVVIYGLDDSSESTSIHKGEFIEKSDLEKLSKDTLVLALYERESLETGSNLIAQLLQKIDVEIFLALGDTNMHLVEALSRVENLSLNVLPTDEIAFKALSAFNKVSNKTSLFIPSSSYNGLRQMSEYVANWVDSNTFNCLIIDSDFSRSRNEKNLRQKYTKGSSITKFIKVINNNLLFINDFNENVKNMITDSLLYEPLSKRSNPKFIIIKFDVLTKHFSYSFPIKQKIIKIFKFNIIRKLVFKCKFFVELTKKQIFLKRLVKALKISQRPIIILGDGVKNSKNLSDFINYFESFRIPIFTSRSAIDLLANDSGSYFGRAGGYGSRTANHIVHQSDFILVLGSRLSPSFVTRNPENFAPNAKIFIIDIDKSELKRSFIKSAIKLRADLKLVLQDVFSAVKSKVDFINYQPWVKIVSDVYSKFNPHELINSLPEKDLYRYISTLTQTFGENDYIVSEGSELLHFINQAAIVKKGQKWVNLTSLEQENYTISAAIGLFINLDNEKQKSRIRIFSTQATLINSLHAMRYIDANNLPVDLYLFLNDESRYVNVGQRNRYPYSFVGFKLMDDKTIITNFLESLKNFSIIKVEKTINNLQTPVNGNCVYLFNVDADQEMDPRPSFEIDSKGNWETKSLIMMDPVNSIDSQIISLFNNSMEI
jgi:acetolactate synthase-1/2/3 large subunit